MAVRFYILKNLDTRELKVVQAASKEEALYKTTKSWSHGTWIVYTSYTPDNFEFVRGIYERNQNEKI